MLSYASTIVQPFQADLAAWEEPVEALGSHHSSPAVIKKSTLFADRSKPGFGPTALEKMAYAEDDQEQGGRAHGSEFHPSPLPPPEVMSEGNPPWLDAQLLQDPSQALGTMFAHANLDPSIRSHAEGMPVGTNLIGTSSDGLIRGGLPSVLEPYPPPSGSSSSIAYPDTPADLSGMSSSTSGLSVPRQAPPSAHMRLPMWQSRLAPPPMSDTAAAATAAAAAAATGLPASAIPPSFAEAFQASHGVDTRPRSVSWSTPSDYLNVGRRRPGRASISAAAAPPIPLPPPPPPPDHSDNPQQQHVTDDNPMQPPWHPSVSLSPGNWAPDRGMFTPEVPSMMQQSSSNSGSSTTPNEHSGAHLDMHLSSAWTSTVPMTTALAAGGPSSIPGPSRTRSTGRGAAQDTVCPYPGCGKVFPKNRLYNLKAHLRSHSNFKPFVCPDCERSFSRKHDLQRHSRVHTGAKPYKCETCEKSFPRSDALRRHWKSEPRCQSRATYLMTEDGDDDGGEPSGSARAGSSDGQHDDAREDDQNEKDDEAGDRAV